MQLTKQQTKNMKPTVKEIQDRLRKLLDLLGAKPNSKKARTIEWALLQGIQLATGDEFPELYIILLASGRSILTLNHER